MQPNLPPEVYWKVFNNDPEGHKVFQELSSLYYDVESYQRGDSYQTAYNEGRRAVIGFIINKMNESQE